MLRSRFPIAFAALCALAVGLAPQARPAPAAATQTAGGLATGVVDPWEYSGSSADRAFADVSRLGSSFVRIYVIWRQVAPRTIPLSASANPADPRYSWGAVDAEVSKAVAHGLTPIFDVLDAPDWARVGVFGNNDPPLAPKLDALGAFARAAAKRYSGSFEGLPRVRYWQAWNEPNLDVYLMPQRAGGKRVSPDYYRSMLTAFAEGVKGPDSTNEVVAGALSPFKQMTGIAPLEFTRDLFCLGPDLKPTCSVKVPVDIWAVHPYSWGGPTWKAQVKDDLSLGDLPALRKTLDAAVKAGQVVSSGKLGLWVTEFSWASQPPTDGAVPMPVLTRWIPEALHQMWLNGVSNVIWFSLYDRPASDFYHSGLFFAPGANGVAKPKPSAAAFRFPFVAYPRKGSLAAWGRTPSGKAGSVSILVRRPGGWKLAGRLRASAQGIFSGRVKAPAGWTFARASFDDSVSPGFAAKAPPAPKLTKLF